MRTFGPDAARYWLAGQGVRVAKPFNLRWLLPAVCGADIKLWWGVWALSWPLLASGTFWWATGTGASWQVAAAATALLLALPVGQQPVALGQRERRARPAGCG